MSHYQKLFRGAGEFAVCAVLRCMLVCWCIFMAPSLAMAVDTTTAGTLEVTPGQLSIAISAPYADDDNSNNTLLIEWGLSGVDYSLGSQIDSHAVSPYTYTIGPLTNGVAYQARVTWQDTDNGSNPVQTKANLIPYNPLIHSSRSTGSSRWSGSGGWGIPGGKYGEFTCITCHEKGSGNIKQVKVLLVAPNGSDEFPIEQATSPNDEVSYTSAEDGSSNAGDDAGGHVVSVRVCEACHVLTDYHRYDTTSDPDAGGPLTAQADLTHYNNADCISCHQHNNAFVHGGSGSGCNSCHGKDADNGGKGSTQSHSTHTENDGDDLRGPLLACSVCHDTSNYPYFASGTDGNGDGKYSLSETDVCDTCHSPGGTYDGVDDATIGAKTNWSSGIYTGDSIAASKEKWCASCHDESPATIDTVDAPNVIGADSGAYTYGAGWGYYKTGHGLESSSTFAASGALIAGAGKACDVCHDYSTAHVDGDPRTYASGSDNYQVGYRLKSINGWAPMNIPRENGVPLDSDDFMLCFTSGCHDSNLYLKQPATITGFRDDVGNGRDSGDTPPINAHEYHLDNMGVRFDSDWDSSYDSQTTCTTCHNVHGSTQLKMVRDGSLKGGSGMTVYYEDDGSATSSLTPPSPLNVTLNNSIATSFNETSAGNLCTVCHGGNYAIYYRSAPGAQQVPTLDWTGEANYVGDGVDPNSGDGGDYYSFRIKYTDANYQIPRAIQVWVDEDDSGTYESGEKYDLLAVDSNDTDVTDGKLYRRILNVGHAGDGTLTYRFYASDGPDVATGDPTHATNNTLIIANNAPALYWTGETGYTADGVNPGSGASGGNFTFRISYVDDDNQAPSSIQVWIDRNDDSDYLDASEKLTLTEVNGGDTNYADGKIYGLTVALSAAGDGSLNYRFFASDGTADAAGLPVNALSVGVTSSNSAPTLSWTNETNYVGNGVDPESDVGDATFSFRINYTDSDNNPPSSIQVWVDKNDDDDFGDAGEVISLTATDGSDLDYTDGKLYAGSTTIAEAGDGVLSYQFYASDGSLVATGTPTNSSFVTILMGAIKVSCPGTGDYDYTTIQGAIDNATDGDTILVADGTCVEQLTIDNKDLIIKSVNGAASTIVDGNDVDDVVIFTNGADTTFEGLTITNGNRGSGFGGGVVISNSSPTFKDCIISDHVGPRGAAFYVSTSGSTVTLDGTTVTGNSASFEGAGMYLSSGASVVISGSTFHDNATGNGGAIYMNTSTDANLTVSDTLFTKNTGSYGGVLYASASGGTVNLSFDNCTFTASDTTDAGTIAATRNGSTNRGGIMYIGDSGATSSLTISNSQILYGNSPIEGGALHLSNIDSTTISNSTIDGNTSGGGGFLKYSNGSTGTLTITDSLIRNNRVTGAYGGAIWMSGGITSIERCIISGNQSEHRGGAVYVSGAAGATATTTIKNCIVSGNKTTSFEGGGFYLTDDGNSAHTAAITNSTFTANNAGSTGGGLYVGSTTAVTAKNSIFWRNRGNTLTGPHEINGTVSAAYSDIRQSGYEGNNNINSDPLFTNAVSYTQAPTTDGDYHLLLSSPAIDMGTAVGAPGDDIDENVRPLGGGVDMGMDEVMLVANSVPTINWTGEAGYSVDGVAPDQATGGANFVFRLNYVDADNHPPGTIQVWIDEDDDGSYAVGEKYNLTAVDGGDTDYTDGKLYSVTRALSYAGDGALTYRFYANDSIEIATGSAVSGSALIVNDVPTLTWIGSGNYASDGVNPDSAASGSSFEFRVTYADSNNHSPTAIQLWIDRNDDGDYLDADEKLTMVEYLTTDDVWSDGKDYYKSVTLTAAGDNTFNFRFFAADGDTATGAPTSDSTVSLVNNAPSLAWVGSGNYTADGVHPDNAVGGASYEFQVSFTDVDNQTPSSIQVWIDKNDDGDHLDGGEKIDMSAVNGGDTDYTDGKLYNYSSTINYAGSGDGYQNYRFYASDGADDATGSPVSAKQVGVFSANNSPDLDWTGAANYTTDGVNPDSGAAGDTFTFRVKYTDVENIAPTSIQLWIDLDDDGTSTGDEGTELLTMNAVDGGDTIYDDGKLYTRDVTINDAGDGSILYKFLASDGTDNATGNAASNQTLTMTAPITVCGSSCDYTTIQAAITASSNGGFIMVKDGAYAENINFNGKLVNVYSQNGAGSTSITGDGTNAAVVTFSSSETSSAVLDGFTLDNANNSGSAARGVYISGASPTIKNSIIEGNSSTNAATNPVGGGGVYITGGSPTFDSCTIRKNVSSNRHGCGMAIVGAAGGATITNTTFGGSVTGDGNKCTSGTAHGSALYYSGSTSGTLSIVGGLFGYNETASGWGGAMYITGVTNETTINGTTFNQNKTSNARAGAIYLNGSPLRLTGATFTNNTVPTNQSGGTIYAEGASASLIIESGTSIDDGQANYGGAIYMTGSTQNPPLQISDSTFNSSYSLYGGGTIYLNALSNTSILNNVTITNSSTTANGYGGAVWAKSSPISVTGSSFSGNTTQSTRSGGGIYVESTSATITGTTFTSNQAGKGGAVASAGTSPSLTLTKVKMIGNKAIASNGGNGGGVQIVAGTATLTNCLIVGNTAGTAWSYGGGISNSGTLNLYHSTVADNWAGGRGGGLQASGTETIRNSIIWGNDAANGNVEIDGSVNTLYLTEISIDPQFTTRDQASSDTPTTGGDYHLLGTSGSIDTGDATNAPADDLDGVAREVDIGGMGDGVDDYDKGAYEYTP